MSRTTRSAAAVVLVTTAFVASPAVAQQGDCPSADRIGCDPLRLDAVYAEVLRASPRLRAAAATADAASHRVPAASTLPDPVLQLGVMNVALPELDADMPSSMAPSIQLTQAFPFPGKLDLAGRVATASSEMAVAHADEAWWEVRERTADLFWELYSLDRRTEVMRGTLALLRDFQTVARSLYASGDGQQSDVLRADVEVARMDGEIRRLEAERTAAAARLNALLDRPADARVGAPALGGLPATAPPADTLRSWARETRPALRRGRVAVDRAERGVELARRQIWPDLTLGVSYGQRDRGMGIERMGSAIVGFSLPVHAGSRQHAARDAASAERRGAEADLRELRAEVDARIAGLLASLETTRHLIGLYRDEILPEARAAVESALSSYRVGAVDFPTLLDAEMAENRFASELHELVAEHGRAVARIESAVGRPLPVEGELVAVVSHTPEDG